MTFSEFDDVMRVIESATEEDLKRIEEMIEDRRQELYFGLNRCTRENQGRQCVHMKNHKLRHQFRGEENTNG